MSRNVIPECAETEFDGRISQVKIPGEIFCFCGSRLGGAGVHLGGGRAQSRSVAPNSAKCRKLEVRPGRKSRALKICRGRRCGGDLWCGSRQSEQVAKQIASAQSLSRAIKHESGRRDSNPRHSAWEADALPTELHPHGEESNIATTCGLRDAEATWMFEDREKRSICVTTFHPEHLRRQTERRVRRGLARSMLRRSAWRVEQAFQRHRRLDIPALARRQGTE